MFGFFKKKENKILSPVDGKVIPITEVNDDVFSSKMLGDGFAVVPSSGEIYAPIDGVISAIFPTKHAVGITTADGLEILVHLGLDTVELDGRPFKMNLTQGEKVSAGQKLVDVDIEMIEHEGKDPVIIVVYTDMNAFKSLSNPNITEVKHGDQVQKFTI